MLTPHADFLASIDNSESTPKLQYFAAVDRSGDWQRIATRFAHILPATDAFPKKLSTIFRFATWKSAQSWSSRNP